MPRIAGLTGLTDYHLHEYILALWGMPLGEMLDLERLSQRCREKNRYFFFFTSSPANCHGAYMLDVIVINGTDENQEASAHTSMAKPSCKSSSDSSEYYHCTGSRPAARSVAGVIGYPTRQNAIQNANIYTCNKTTNSIHSSL